MPLFFPFFRNPFLFVIPLILALITFSPCYSQGLGSDFQQNGDSFSVMSYNLRYDNPGDSINSWDHRKEALANEILFYSPDFIGIQEGLHHMLEYLKEHLGDWEYIGVGRADGKTEGEYSAIFYNTKRFRLIPGTEQTLWLSPTPEVPSKGWDAALPRIVTMGKFKSLSSGKTVFMANTHFDHRGHEARHKSAELILKLIKEDADRLPAVLTGDFNVPESHEPYKIITGSFMRDAWYDSKLPAMGPKSTFRGFDVCKPSKGKSRIDFLFVNEPIEVLKIGSLSNFTDGYFLSDHIPVYGQLRWKE